MYLTTYGFGFILYVSILFIILALIWTRKDFGNFIIKCVFMLSGIAGLIIIFGK